MQSDNITTEKETIIKLISDKETLVNIVLLLAFIRNAMKKNTPQNINLKINTKRPAKLSFSVNNEAVSDFFVKDSIIIN